jgi:hypothetical protein
MRKYPSFSARLGNVGLPYASEAAAELQMAFQPTPFAESAVLLEPEH